MEENQKIIIFGNNNFAKMMAEYIEEFTTSKVVCFTVDAEYISENEIDGKPVEPFSNIETKYSPEEHRILVALGYKSMNSLREQFFAKSTEKGYEIASFIHPSATLNSVELGEGNIVLEDVYFGKNSKVGKGNIFWNRANISHNANIGNFNYFSPSVTLSGDIEVENNCFFGTGCITVNGISVSDKTLLGAGCVLQHSTDEGDVIVPAKSVKIEKNSSEINLK